MNKQGMKFPKIEGNKRIVFLGKTRTGKSTMARFLLEMKVSEGWWVVIIDPKKGWMMREEGRKSLPYGQFGDFQDPETGYKYKDFRGSIEYPIWSSTFNPEIRVMIYTPVSWDSFIDDMIDMALAHKYVIFYFDEVRQLATSNKTPQKFIVLYTQGAASLCGAWAGNQRPVGIPEDMKSQAEIWISFYVNKVEDRQVVADYIPYNEYLKWYVQYDLPYYYFLYFDDRMTGPVIMPPLSLPGVRPEIGRGGQVVQFRNERTG